MYLLIGLLVSALSIVVLLSILAFIGYLGVGPRLSTWWPTVEEVIHFEDNDRR